MTISLKISASKLLACLGASLVLLTASVRAADDWQALFDGQDLSAWRTLARPDSTPAWKIEDGTLAWSLKCGDLATKQEFGDFELELEWKISPGGNSGILFRVDASGAKPWHTGPEMQVLDDARHKDGKSPLTSAGSLYALYPPAKAAAKPVGEWNSVRIRVKGSRIDYWLNGENVISVEVGSADWTTRVAASKFAPFARFGRTSQGRIVLQDHGDPVWFRNIRIRKI